MPRSTKTVPLLLAPEPSKDHMSSVGDRGHSWEGRLSKTVHNVYKIQPCVAVSLWLEKPETVIKFANPPGSKFLLSLNSPHR